MNKFNKNDFIEIDHALNPDNNEDWSDCNKPKGTVVGPSPTFEPDRYIVVMGDSPDDIDTLDRFDPRNVRWYQNLPGACLTKVPTGATYKIQRAVERLRRVFK